MKMTFRWYGSKHDKVTLKQIRQIPGLIGVISTLYDIPAGEVWPVERIRALKDEIESAGLTLEGIESVNVHEDIKLGTPEAEKYIENYKQTLRNLAECGVKLVCYNFMPVFDWTRTDLAKILEDGSNTLSYDEDVIRKIDPAKMFEEVNNNSNGYVLPGWEPERLGEIKRLLELYSDMTEEKLWKNLENFLKEVIPVAEECDIKMAIHPDDPPWSVFGLPRLITSKENLERFINLVDSPYNGLTICTGSLGVDPNNNIPEIIRYFGSKGRIHFAHVRNVKIHEPRKFDEVAHKSEYGSLDMFEIMKAFYDVKFEGPIRPDHGRMIWDEEGRPGYGLYDRALGAVYLNGLWEAISKMDKLNNRN
ncbi:mannonate dehydratase [Thermoclostridium stercorarium]|uniref:mannonate dehydratase n=1 Tax=Thermoclostridium stercorarium TaxID=1510 RepID=UPI00224934C3|nr:mannonate dehydratase [Thermoclostridium stercorarium]UZQ86067.1 mannonate dehydratase [Thermoclostridium stercorarium]